MTGHNLVFRSNQPRNIEPNASMFFAICWTCLLLCFQSFPGGPPRTYILDCQLWTRRGEYPSCFQRIRPACSCDFAHCPPRSCVDPFADSAYERREMIRETKPMA
jgi:hypothetical protein